MRRSIRAFKELNMIYLLLLAVSIVFTVAGQLMLKRGVNGQHLTLMTLRLFIFNPFVILGFLSYGASLLLWLVVISKLELSYAYPLVSSNYFFITLLSKVFFKEHVSKKRWLSISIIILGVILVSLS